jgi:hypothetical protein
LESLPPIVILVLFLELVPLTVLEVAIVLNARGRKADDDKTTSCDANKNKENDLVPIFIIEVGIAVVRL